MKKSTIDLYLSSILIYAFKDILFTIYNTTYIFSQEYKDFKSPNNNRVYISYLDSVQFLDVTIRSKMYKTVILGYFKYCGELG